MKFISFHFKFPLVPGSSFSLRYSPYSTVSPGSSLGTSLLRISGIPGVSRSYSRLIDVIPNITIRSSIASGAERFFPEAPMPHRVLCFDRAGNVPASQANDRSVHLQGQGDLR